MPQRVITASVGVAGLVVIGLGVASATVWKADDVLVATAPAGSAIVTTAPGVLELGGDPVTVRATTAGGAPVVLAVGRENDVTSWVGTDAHDEVTGLSGWHDLAVDRVKAGEPTAAPSSDASPNASASPKGSASPKASASAKASPSASAASEASDDASTADDPTDSDLWVAQATGKGSAQLVWPAQDGRWSLIAVGTGDAAPVLQMSWPRVVTTPWLWPLVVLGTLMVLVAGALLGRDLYRRRTGTQDPEWHDVTTGTIALVGENGAPLTRRQLREAELARSGRPRTGSVPRVEAPTSGSTPAVEAAREQTTTGAVPSSATSSSATSSSAAAASAAGGVDRASQVAPAGPPRARDDQPGAGSAPTAPPASSPASAPTAAIPTTRRALRTGAIPTVAAGTPTRPDDARPAASGPDGWSGTASDAASGLPGDQQPPTSARRTVSAPGWLSGAGRRPVEPPTQTPTGAGAPDISSAQTAAIPATGWTPVPSTTPGTPGVQGPTSTQGPTNAGAPGAPGATRAPGGAPAADAGRATHRPAWLAPGAPTPAPGEARPTAGEQSTTDAPTGQAASRADAWRRAWGLPAQPDDPPADQDGSTTEVDR